jgi:hypothetical protein
MRSYPTVSRPWLVVACGIVTAFGAILGVPSAARSQGYDLVERARRLENAGEYWAAASTLRAHLWNHPDDAHVRWPLGRLLYWLGDPEAALAELDRARVALPDEAWLHIDRARILMDFVQVDSARAALELARSLAPPGGSVETEAWALLGTLWYWEGEYSRAARLFEEALQREPDRTGAREQLGAIRSTMRPWVQLGLGVVDDNQPYGSLSATVVAGRYLTPLWTMAAGVTPRGFDAPGVGTAAEGWVRLAGSVPVRRIAASASVGRTWQSSLAGDDGAWIGDLTVERRLESGVRVRLRGWAQRYLWTLASADTLVLTRGLELALDAAAAPTWAGEVVLRREILPGSNTIGTAYAWGLAPVRPGLRVGYAFSWQDSEESRWVPAPPDPDPPGPGRGRGPPVGGTGASTGWYAPYFTPLDTYIHSALVELRRDVGSGTARLNVSRGIWARERAPSLQATGMGAAAPQTVFIPRRFTPWSVTGTVELPVGCCLVVRAEAERGRTAFYRMTRVTAGLVYRFARHPAGGGP